MGAGYVGMALLTSFEKKSYEVCITTTQKERVEMLKLYGQQVLLLNSADDQNLKETLETCDGIIILIAPKNSQSYEETYLHTAKRIVSALGERLTPFYILYISSTSVYEGTEGEWVFEDSPLHPYSENAKILLQTERCYLNAGVDTCILRLGGIYGPKRDLLDRARRFSGTQMSGTGLEPTNHIHLSDIINAINFCLTSSLLGIYNLVSDSHPTRKGLYSSLCFSLGLPIPIWNDTESKIKSYKVSNQKIKESGFTFTHLSI